MSIAAGRSLRGLLQWLGVLPCECNRNGWSSLARHSHDACARHRRCLQASQLHLTLSHSHNFATCLVAIPGTQDTRVRKRVYCTMVSVDTLVSGARGERDVEGCGDSHEVC